jgi:hypothetical protein
VAKRKTTLEVVHKTARGLRDAGLMETNSESQMKKQTFESVWDALEESTEASASMQVRATLMIEVQRYVNEDGLTQIQAAKQ